ncbi:MAG: N-acetyltransferase [Cyanobacteria bacterium J069]|nr:MAG: N-acetyltransferase [Cyanobacteria bacterium J069]
MIAGVTVGRDVFLSALLAEFMGHPRGAANNGEPGTILIRTARSRDLPELADVLASSFHNREGVLGWAYPLFRAGILDDLRGRLHRQTPHYACLVAIEQTGSEETLRERVVGTLEMNLHRPPFWQMMGDRYLYISNLAVRSGYRRRGIALQLLQTCDRIAAEWRFPDLYLHTLENNTAARLLYEKAGYRVSKTEWNPVTWIVGQPQQLFLQKQLLPPAG